MKHLSYTRSIIDELIIRDLQKIFDCLSNSVGSLLLIAFNNIE